MTNTLNAFTGGAVGFIDWLGLLERHLVHPFVYDVRDLVWTNLAAGACVYHARASAVAFYLCLVIRRMKLAQAKKSVHLALDSSLAQKLPELVRSVRSFAERVERRLLIGDDARIPDAANRKDSR